MLAGTALIALFVPAKGAALPGIAVLAELIRLADAAAAWAAEPLAATAIVVTAKAVAATTLLGLLMVSLSS